MNNTRRNMVSLVLLFVFFLAALLGEIAPNAFASSSEPTVTVERRTSAAGSRIDVDVVIENNPGILGATFVISYSPKLELMNGRLGDAFSGLTMTKPGQFTSPCKFVWDGQELSVGDIKDGTILTLTFQVSEAASPGEILPIEIVCAGDVYDANLQPIQVSMTGGSVTVAEEILSDQALLTSGVISDGRINIDVSSQRDAVQTILVLAGYAESGQQVECQIQRNTLLSGDNSYQFFRKSDAVIYKAFLLDLSISHCCPALIISATPLYIVTFLDYDGTELSKQTVPAGESATPPSPPERAGFAFTGWSGDYTSITGDCTLTAQYTVDTDPTVVVSTVNARPGDTEVEVTVSIRNNPGILGMTLVLNYDSDVLTLKNAVNGDAVKDVLALTKPGEFVSPCKFVWDGQELSQDAIQDGTILTLRFDVASTAAAGTYPITVSYNRQDVIDNDLNNVNLSISSGSIVVQ